MIWKVFFNNSNDSREAVKEQPQEKSTAALNRVDICFVVDNTGSMGPFINAAKQQLIDVIEQLSNESGVDLAVGTIAYRDHPPQESSFITRVHDLTTVSAQARQAINSMAAHGGGDTAEAVYQGIFDCVHKVSWRAGSCRFAILVGDAAPHGFGSWYNERYNPSKAAHEGDAWTTGCPSNLDVLKVGAELERKGITLHAICQGGSTAAKLSFALIAGASGGQCMNVSGANDVILRIVSMLHSEFKDLEFDKQVLEQVERNRNLDPDVLGEQLGTTRLKTVASLARLGKRGFLRAAI